MYDRAEFPIIISLHQVLALNSYLFALLIDELTWLIQDEVPLVYDFCR